MGEFVNYWVIAFLLSFFLSMSILFTLIVCWVVIPESLEGEMTRAGERLHRARSLCAITCGVTFTWLAVLVYFLTGPDRSQPFQWFREHRQIAPAISMVFAVLLGVSFLLTLSGRGPGRRGLLIGTFAMTALSIGVASCLIDY
jgi:hypothetical protein